MIISSLLIYLYSRLYCGLPVVSHNKLQKMQEIKQRIVLTSSGLKHRGWSACARTKILQDTIFEGPFTTLTDYFTIKWDDQIIFFKKGNCENLPIVAPISGSNVSSVNLRSRLYLNEKCYKNQLNLFVIPYFLNQTLGFQ